MPVKSIRIDNIDKIKDRIEKRLAAFAKKLNLDVRIGATRYNEKNAKIVLKVSVIDPKTGVVQTAEHEQFKKVAREYGLSDKLLDRRFNVGDGKSGKLIGYNERAPQNKFIMNVEGRRASCSFVLLRKLVLADKRVAKLVRDPEKVPDYQKLSGDVREEVPEALKKGRSAGVSPKVKAIEKAKNKKPKAVKAAAVTTKTVAKMAPAPKEVKGEAIVKKVDKKTGKEIATLAPLSDAIETFAKEKREENIKTIKVSKGYEDHLLNAAEWLEEIKGPKASSVSYWINQSLKQLLEGQGFGGKVRGRTIMLPTPIHDLFEGERVSRTGFVKAIRSIDVNEIRP